MKPPRVAAIVVHYGPEDLCRVCLESVERSAGVAAFPFVVDQNPSPCAALEALARKEGGAYLSNPANPGFAAGANAGIRGVLAAGGADLLVLLNPDVRLDPACLRTLHGVCAADPAIGLCGPGLLSEAQPGVWWNVGGEVSWPSGRPRSWLHGRPREESGLDVQDTGFVCGSVLAIAPGVLEKIGLLREDYYLYFEDAELSLRARAAGLRTVVCPGAVAWHRGGASLAGCPVPQSYYRVRNRLLFSRDWNPSPLLGRLHRLLFALRAVSRSLGRFAFSPGGEALLPARGVLDYFLNRRGRLGA